MGKYFGTDGIRGRFGDGLINPEFAFRLGSALGLYLCHKKPALPLNVVIGRDTRSSGPVLVHALTQGLNQRGIYVHDAGTVPTPAVALAVREQDADLGIAITASHNPASDNGIKLFSSAGTKFDEAREAEIEALVDAQSGSGDDLPAPRAYDFDAASVYINYIRSLMHQNCLDGWKIVFDLANGATCKTTPAVFRHWGVELILSGDKPSGDNINDGVGSEHPEKLARAVLKAGANLGIAHDGDGDRVVICDEKGEIVEGDVLLGIFGLFALQSGSLKQNTLVATVQSNLGLDHAIKAAGGTVERVDVGDRNVSQRMQELGSNIGGESSGHIIFSDFATTGDGLLAAAKLVEVVCKTGKSLSELRKEVALFPQKSLSLKVVEKIPFEDQQHLPQAIRVASDEFGENGRVLVRYSGTEPKLRILVEGKDSMVVTTVLKKLEKAARADLEVIDS